MVCPEERVDKNWYLKKEELDKLAKLIEDRNYQSDNGNPLSTQILETLKREYNSHLTCLDLYKYLDPRKQCSVASEEEADYFNSRREFYRERKEEAEIAFQESLKELPACEALSDATKHYEDDPESLFNDPNFIERLTGIKCKDGKRVND